MTPVIVILVGSSSFLVLSSTPSTISLDCCSKVRSTASCVGAESESVEPALRSKSSPVVVASRPRCASERRCCSAICALVQVTHSTCAGAVLPSIGVIPTGISRRSEPGPFLLVVQIVA